MKRIAILFSLVAFFAVSTVSVQAIQKNTCDIVQVNDDNPKKADKKSSCADKKAECTKSKAECTEKKAECSDKKKACCDKNKSDKKKM